MRTAVRYYLTLVLGLAPLWCGVGCQHLTMREPGYESREQPAARQGSRAAESTRPASETKPVSNQQPVEAIPEASVHVQVTDKPSGPIPREELAEILRELEEIGETDPELQRELMTSVRQLMQQSEQDPLLWSRMRGTIKAAISYRKQLAKRQHEQQAELFAAETSEPNKPVTAQPRAKPPSEPATAPSPAESTYRQPTVTPVNHTELHQPASVHTEPPVASVAVMPHRSADELLTPPSERASSNLTQQLSALRGGPWAFGNSGQALSVTEDESTLRSSLSTDWTAHLQQAITSLESQTQQSPQTNDDINRQAALRMLYLLEGNRDKAVAPIPGISPELQDFWSNQLYGLSVVQDSDHIEDPARRATEAATHLRYANQRLGEAAILEVRNLAFCKSAQGFGLYEPFSPSNFNAAQQVVLYLEVENFRTEPSEQGHSLSLAGGFRIIDERGKQRYNGQLGAYKEQCRSRRRDLYYSNLIRMPANLSPGAYTMQVTVEDKVSRRTADASIEFTIVGSTRSVARGR